MIQDYRKEENKMRKFRINVNGSFYDVEVEEVGGAVAAAPVAAAPIAAPAAPAAAPAPAPAPAGGTAVEAPMPGKIVSVKVSVGQTVNEGDVVCVLEAMKMENEIMAPTSGKIVAVSVSNGDSVNTGDAIVSIG